MHSLVCTLLSLHSHEDIPMTKTSVLAICRVIELLKCVQHTFHRRAMLVAEYSSHIINHYELELLSALESVSRAIQESQQKGYSERALVGLCVCVHACVRVCMIEFISYV